MFIVGNLFEKKDGELILGTNPQTRYKLFDLGEEPIINTNTSFTNELKVKLVFLTGNQKSVRIPCPDMMEYELQIIYKLKLLFLSNKDGYIYIGKDGPE